MAKKEHLYDLIQTLTPSEKRHFRSSFNKKDKEPDHLKLFDLMASMKSFDADRISKKFPKHTPNRLAQLKSHTSELLLKFLLQSEELKQPEDKVRHLFALVKIHRDRGLLERSIQLMDRAIVFCRKMCDDMLLLESLKLWRQLIGRWRTVTTPERIEATMQEMVDVGARVHLMMKVRLLHTSFHQRIVHTGSIERDQQAWLNAELATDWFREALESANPRLQVMANSILGQRDTFLVDYDGAYRHWSKAHEVSREIAVESEVDENNRISCLSNRNNAAIRGRFFHLMPELLAETSEIKCQSRSADLKHFESYLNVRMHFVNMTGQSLGEEDIEEIEREISTNRLTPAFRLSITLQMGVYWLIHDRSDLAAKRLETFLNDQDAGQLKQHATFATLVRLLLHYQDGEIDLLESVLRARERYLKMHPSRFGFEDLTIDLLKQVLKSPRNEHQKHLKNYQDKLDAIRSDEIYDLYFDFSSWAIAMQKKCSMEEVLQERTAPLIKA